MFDMTFDTYINGISVLLKLLLLTGGCHLIFSFLKKRRYNFPPGPRNYPVLGCTISLDHKAPFKTFSEWARKYGRLYYCKLGKDDVLIVNDHELVKSLFANDVCKNRPENPGSMLRRAESGGHAGLIFSSGQEWKDHRRFVLRSLKDLGVGRRSIEDKITEEAECLVQTFSESNGNPFENKLFVTTAVANVIANIVWDERYEITDVTFHELLASVMTLFRTSALSALLNSYFWLRFIPPFRGVFNMYDECSKKIGAYFQLKSKEHIATWQVNNDRDMIDAYISSVKQREFETFDETHQLAYVVEDLMEAGFETTSTALRWAFLLMCAHPDIQRKVQAELDANIRDGSSAKPSDKLHLPYSEAVLAEVQRFSSFVPFGVMHATETDGMNIEGYTVPINTWILPNLYFIHHDEKLWGDPFEFRPERFLSSAGEFSEPEFYIPFSVGRRRCPGENLARIELLIFFTAVLKEMTLRLPDGASHDLTPVAGATLDTPAHSIIAVPRKR